MPQTGTEADRVWLNEHPVGRGDQPCLCLCFGFSQIMRIDPLRLITLHFSHIGLTEDLTFIGCLLSFTKLSVVNLYHRLIDLEPFLFTGSCSFINSIY